MTISVLAISKPVIPPWNDSSKNLVRDLISGSAADQIAFSVLTDGSHSFDLRHVRERPIYGGGGGFAPGLRQNAKVVKQVLITPKGWIQHFFFAPNPRTSSVIRRLRRIVSRKAVHTICSVPKDFATVRTSLFADINVALSRYTRDRLVDAGVANTRYIPPSVPPVELCLDREQIGRARSLFDLPHDAPVVVFPGDYSFSDAARTVASAIDILKSGSEPPVWVFACRIKDEESLAVEKEIKSQLGDLIPDGRVRFLNQVPRILDLLTAADLVVLPAESSYAKMDLPLVLLEAIGLGRPVIVADQAPLNEVLDGGGGIAVPPHDPEGLAHGIRALLDDPEKRLQMGRDGAAFVAANYGRETIAAQYLNVYRELVG